MGRRGADAEQGRAPVDRGGLEQRLDVDVERAEPDAGAVERVAVGLVERGELRGDRAAREQAARIDQHRGERAHPGAGLLVGGGDGEVAQRGDVVRDLALDPLLEPRAEQRRGARPRGGRAGARCAPRARAASGRGRGGRGCSRPSRWRARRLPRPGGSRCRGRRTRRRRGVRALRPGGARRRRGAGACRRGGRSGSTLNSNPARWPIGSGPTLTSPSAATVTGSASAPCAPMSRTRTAVRRSTKRWVSRSWSASDRRPSTVRVRSAHLAGSASQSGRWAI